MREPILIEPNQSFIVDSFKSEDAIGIRNLFISVYGEKYPIDIYYHPHNIIRANKNKTIYSVVARTQKGQIIGHGALYRTFSDNKKLYELGQLVVHNNYRNTMCAYHISRFIEKQIIKRLAFDGIFGEAITKQTISQRLSYNMGLRETAIEIGLIPASIYKDEALSSERISCLFQFLLKRDYRHIIYLNLRAKELAEFAINRLKLKRDIAYLTSNVSCRNKSRIKGVFLEKIGIMRFNIIHIGIDIEMSIEKIIDEADSRDIVIQQFVINISEEGALKTFNILFNRGFFIGGLLPLWFKTGDGFLVQRINEDLSFDNINLYSKQAWHILNLVMKDYERHIKR